MLIDYAAQNLRAELKAATGGRGVDLVFDPVGGALAEPEATGWPLTVTVAVGDAVTGVTVIWAAALGTVAR